MPPIKLVNIPDRLIYTRNNTYNMASTKNGAYLGRIKLLPQKDSLLIADINSNFRENKELRVGTSLINFAKKISKRLGLGGKLEVEAYNYEYRGKPSPQFFRKQGFTTKDPKKDDLLDFCTEYNIDIPHNMKQGVTMYYTPRG